MKTTSRPLPFWAGTGLLSLALAPALTAATTVIFSGFPQNSDIGTNTFADNVSATGTGVVASVGGSGITGTPNIDVAWNTSGLTQFYNSWDGRGDVAQLDYLAVGSANPISWTFTPAVGVQAVITSFELDVWAGGGNAQINWSVAGSLGSSASGIWTRSTGGRDLISPALTGLSGEVLTLSFNRVSGLGNYLALDNLVIDQVGVPEPTVPAMAALSLGALAMRRRRRLA